MFANTITEVTKSGHFVREFLNEYEAGARYDVYFGLVHEIALDNAQRLKTLGHDAILCGLNGHYFIHSMVEL